MISKPYEDLTHCIHCGKKGFKDVDEVIKHIKSGCNKR